MKDLRLIISVCLHQHYDDNLLQALFYHFQEPPRGFIHQIDCVEEDEKVHELLLLLLLGSVGFRLHPGSQPGRSLVGLAVIILIHV
mmetsp:Transcript_14114/g.13716  ORF Transcript_14114/g.13716 Transcript_14114/m.13716 type:complete len:86 (+) Transcript_14114:477-734(+)